MTLWRPGASAIVGSASPCAVMRSGSGARKAESKCFNSRADSSFIVEALAGRDAGSIPGGENFRQLRRQWHLLGVAAPLDARGDDPTVGAGKAILHRQERRRVEAA